MLTWRYRMNPEISFTFSFHNFRNTACVDCSLSACNANSKNVHYLHIYSISVRPVISKIKGILYHLIIPFIFFSFLLLQNTCSLNSNLMSCFFIRTYEIRTEREALPSPVQFLPWGDTDTAAYTSRQFEASWFADATSDSHWATLPSARPNTMWMQKAEFLFTIKITKVVNPGRSSA